MYTLLTFIFRFRAVFTVNMMILINCPFVITIVTFNFIKSFWQFVFENRICEFQWFTRSTRLNIQRLFDNSVLKANPTFEGQLWIFHCTLTLTVRLREEYNIIENISKTKQSSIVFLTILTQFRMIINNIHGLKFSGSGYSFSRDMKSRLWEIG